MDGSDAIERLEILTLEARELKPDIRAHFTTWRHTVRAVFVRALGANHSITQEFDDLQWHAIRSYEDEAETFSAAVEVAVGLMSAAMIEINTLADETALTGLDDATADPELWNHVAPQIRSSEWGKVATLAVVFTEDRIRKWAGRPPTEVGVDLASAVFGPKGNFRLGITDPEKEGWQLLAMGLAKAVRNVDAHRVQTRDDHKRYALGVVGTCSLLLTQMRHEHGNRFHDMAPVPPDGLDGEAR